MTRVRQAIVLAAGAGVRLRPVTLHTPKPLIPFYGRPLLDWAIDKLAAGGVTRIAVNAFHLAEQIVAHAALLSARHPNLELLVRREPILLGTGGAVRNLRDWLTPGEPFFVLNADAIFAATPDQLTSLAPAPDAALLVTREPTYASERRLVADADQRLIHLDEAGAADGYAFCGLTLADPSLPDRLPDGPSCILRQGFVPHLSALDVRLVETSAFFADTGTPEALIDAHVRGLSWVRTLDLP